MKGSRLVKSRLDAAFGIYSRSWFDINLVFAPSSLIAFATTFPFINNASKSYVSLAFEVLVTPGILLYSWQFLWVLVTFLAISITIFALFAALCSWRRFRLKYLVLKDFQMMMQNSYLYSSWWHVADPIIAIPATIKIIQNGCKPIPKIR